ncbi:hypothetical protein [Actinopolymorpha sp. B9G3]|uniref:DUF4350 domain-containing protein n=1 Tax=Actinopolymorpha sp. B9G3 TaxID=3158970 RepID=UPI0032D96452
MTIGVVLSGDQTVGRFGRYLAEILRAEGMVDHEILDLSDENLGGLASCDLVLVARIRPTKAQVGRLLDYAAAGGRLILVRPSPLLARTLGLVSTHTMVAPAYVRPGTASPLGSGVPQEPIETHVPADAYAPDALPDGAVTVARLQADVRTPTAFPAVVELPYGAGRVVVFTYDLPHAVALIRQGDPGRIGGHGLGAGEPYRIQDLLTGFADPRCWHLPQADIHAMLLGNAVNHLARHPQPRWWYYPTPELRSVLVLDSDDDWSAPEHFDALIDAVESHGGQVTIYLMSGTTRGTVATKERVARWRERGHSFGIHHDPSDPAYGGEDQEEILPEVVRKDVREFAEVYGGVPATNRNHCAVWKGYADLPKLYAELGIDMDLNSMNVGPSWLAYLTGSARPMRFVDADGTVIDCFQQATQAYDDLSVKELLTADPLGQAGLTRLLMEDKLDRYFSPLSMLSHPVSFATYSSTYMHRCWTSARELGMPIWSAFAWAEFTRARDAARIHDTRWEGETFSCQVTGRSPAGGLTVVLPVPLTRVHEALVDGEPARIGGLEMFGWPSVLVYVELDPGDDRTRHLSLTLHPDAS